MTQRDNYYEDDDCCEKSSGCCVLALLDIVIVLLIIYGGIKLYENSHKQETGKKVFQHSWEADQEKLYSCD